MWHNPENSESRLLVSFLLYRTWRAWKVFGKLSFSDIDCTDIITEHSNVRCHTVFCMFYSEHLHQNTTQAAQKMYRLTILSKPSVVMTIDMQAVAGPDGVCRISHEQNDLVILKVILRIAVQRPVGSDGYYAAIWGSFSWELLLQGWIFVQRSGIETWNDDSEYIIISQVLKT